MPSRQMNQRLWSRYNWNSAGEEWSENWGSTANLWYGTLMPRIGAFLRDARVVEIGPGHGRLSAYLARYCSSLVLVDLVPACIDFCRRRFAKSTNIEYFVNDGSSLACLEDKSVDLVFSFDSLVHADREVMTGYLSEIERVLRVGGRAVLHHSNLAALLADTMSTMDPLANFHLRARDVSAEIISSTTTQLETLECRTQELISWDASLRLIDCISSFIRCDPRTNTSLDRYINAGFYDRARELRAMSERYQGQCSAHLGIDSFATRKGR